MMVSETHLNCSCSKTTWEKAKQNFFLSFFLIGGKFLYNIMLVSAVQQHESVLIIFIYPHLALSFPGGLEGKASACNVGDPGSIPESGRSPGKGNGNPLQYSCLENPMDGGAW